MVPASDDQGVYLLSEPGHLLWFRDTVNGGSAKINAKLTKDIDLSEGGSPSHWTPIGQYTTKTPDGYAGSFDGGGFTVSGYIVADVVSADEYGNLAAGFFGLAGQSADIRGLTVGGVVSVDISNDTDTILILAGGIAGLSYGTITDCANNGGVSASGGSAQNNAGGIAGINSGTITDNANSGGVSASGGSENNAGGIAGRNDGTITNCANKGRVSADGGSNANYAGGIAGYNYGTITNNTHSGGGVSASSSSNFNNAGGIAGRNDGTITNNAHSGSVSASGGSYSYAGGIAGLHYSGTITNNAHSGGDISASGGSYSYAGGIAGYNDYMGKITNNAHSGGTVTASGGSAQNNAGGIAGGNGNGTITNNVHSGGTVTASGGSAQNNAGGIAGINGGTIANNAHSGGDVSASGDNTNNAGGIAGYNNGTIANNASGGEVSADGGSENYNGGIVGYNNATKVNISNSCWPTSSDLEAVGSGDKGTDAVSADVVSLDAAEMKMVVTTVLPVERTLSVEIGGSAPALISYPGTTDDMTNYFSVRGDISVASPDIAGISGSWPCTVSGKKPGVTAVSFKIDLKATDFSDKNNLKPLAASCATDPLSFTVAVSIPVTKVSLDVTELMLNIGESKKLTATVKPDDATYKAITWTSANPAVAAVDDTGKVTALSAGTTVVTAKAGGKSATCKVTVAQPKTGGSGSSHGCAAGLGALSMLTLIPLWLRKKR